MVRKEGRKKQRTRVQKADKKEEFGARSERGREGASESSREGRKEKEDATGARECTNVRSYCSIYSILVPVAALHRWIMPSYAIMPYKFTRNTRNTRTRERERTNISRASSVSSLFSIESRRRRRLLCSSSLPAVTHSLTLTPLHSPPCASSKSEPEQTAEGRDENSTQRHTERQTRTAVSQSANRRSLDCVNESESAVRDQLITHDESESLSLIERVPVITGCHRCCCCCCCCCCMQSTSSIYFQCFLLLLLKFNSGLEDRMAKIRIEFERRISLSLKNILSLSSVSF